MNIKLVATVTLSIALMASYLITKKDGNLTDEESINVAESRSLESDSVNSSAPSRHPVGVSTAAKEIEKQSVADNASQTADNDVEGPKWPGGVENLILDYFSQQNGFEFAAISSVQCQIQTCEIVFSGTNPNPLNTDDFSDFVSGFNRPPINARRGSFGTREIAAGAREYVINISNVPYVEPTDRE